ncbi:hypothetical protein FISHEDRAFT_68859 [Fistulina hepatica ATCC 64428]|uniref:Uncharacterized protein n=1 Tax=Fistulina hepatica ATCC 64428 TaxID=1128425 RepID=A0A0D7APK1_9AGAR|nr:hypothetical protein FISHEDRAFT_68859 [Fistulina hepatica ATCC 64428]
MTKFGDFQPLCRNVPSYPWCNLFYRQLLDLSSSNETLIGLSAKREYAPVGVDPVCGILRRGASGSLANIANIIVIALSIIVTAVLLFLTNRRKAAVGRIELRTFLALYFVSLPLQLVTTGALTEQGNKGLVVVTGKDLWIAFFKQHNLCGRKAIHAGVVAALFWALLSNALISTQVVEDGTMSSMIPYGIGAVVFFAGTTYISLDVALHITDALGPSSDVSALHSIPLFVLTSIWPAVSAVLYLAIMAYVVLGVLQEFRPLIFYMIAAVLFVLSQLDYFLLSKVICKGTSYDSSSISTSDGTPGKIDGSFIATILETACVGVIFLAWKSITEESWDDDYGAYGAQY